MDLPPEEILGELEQMVGSGSIYRSRTVYDYWFSMFSDLFPKLFVNRPELRIYVACGGYHNALITNPIKEIKDHDIYSSLMHLVGDGFNIVVNKYAVLSIHEDKNKDKDYIFFFKADEKNRRTQGVYLVYSKKDNIKDVFPAGYISSEV